MRLTVLLALALIPVTAAARKLATPKLDATLKTHLAAISARNLAGLLATVADDVTLILPNGKLLEGKDAYRTFHEEWFAEKTWTMAFKELRRSERGDSAFVLLETDYRDSDEKGQPVQSRSYLVMVFKLSAGRWLLTYDQNTRLPPPSP